MSLLYNPLDEAMRKKMHNVFMIRWSVFHAPIHSAVFPMDKPGFEQDEVTVCYVCGWSGLKTGVSVCVSHEIEDYCVNRN